MDSKFCFLLSCIFKHNNLELASIRKIYRKNSDVKCCLEHKKHAFKGSKERLCQEIDLKNYRLEYLKTHFK